MKYSLITILFIFNIFNVYGIKFLGFSQCFGVKLKYLTKASMSSATREYQRFQWSLFEKSFNGKWCSPHTYVYDSNKQLIDLLPTTKYELTFYQNKTCLWNGTGLRYTPNNKLLFYNESTLNNHGMVFLFPGCGGNSYRHFDINKKEGSLLPIEVNFFNNNTRSMIIIYYKVGNKTISLDSIQVTPFRNLRNPNSYYSMYDTPSILKSVEHVVHKMSTDIWDGERFFYEPNKQYFNKICLNEFNLFPYLSCNKNLLKATFEDGLILIAPKIIPIEKHFSILFGAMMNDKLYKQLMINYDIDGNLTRWVYDIYNISKQKTIV